MYRNRSFSSQTLTNSATIYLNPAHNIESIYEGSILFTAKGTKASGTFSVTAQLQGSNDSAFANVVDIGAAVTLTDTVNAAVVLSGNALYYAYYRVAVIGGNTQSVAVIGTYTAKGKDNV